MDRRLGGLALLAVACLCVLIVPNLSGRPTGGSAIAVYVPPPPQAGQCVIHLSAVPQDDGGEGDPRVAYPVATYGPCGANVVGEVMSVEPETLAAPPVTLSSYTGASAKCELAEVNYVGSIGPFDLTNPNTPSIAWQTTVSIQSVSVGPTALQQRAGQTWTACVGTTSNNAPYTGRIADALTRGTLPPTYAMCWGTATASGPTPDDASVRPCSEPHAAEILGTTEVTDPRTTVADIQRTCRGFAGRAMRTSDPTRGGVITVGAYSQDGAAVQSVTKADLTSGFLVCLAQVDAPHQLVGTVIGLGDHPAPVTG